MIWRWGASIVPVSGEVERLHRSWSQIFYINCLGAHWIATQHLLSCVHDLLRPGFFCLLLFCSGNCSVAATPQGDMKSSVRLRKLPACLNLLCICFVSRISLLPLGSLEEMHTDQYYFPQPTWGFGIHQGSDLKSDHYVLYWATTIFKLLLLQLSLLLAHMRGRKALLFSCNCLYVLSISLL